MGKLFFIFALSFGSVILGYLIRRALAGRLTVGDRVAATISKDLKLLSMFALNPVPIVASFWTMPLGVHRLFLLPALGLVSVSVGGASAVALCNLFRVPPKKAASVFTSGMFTNILTFGGLIAFVFFGSNGYAFVQLFNLFISATYYLVGFPLSHRLSLESHERASGAPSAIKDRPYLLIPIIGIAVGLALNLTGVARPPLVGAVADVFVPLVSATLGLSIGLTLHVGRVGAYRKEISLILLIKFVIIPVFVIPLSIALGLPDIMGGIPYKVLVLLSFMPVAFNSLVPPAIYGFDLDLANSAWIVSTFSLVVVLPLLYVILLH